MNRIEAINYLRASGFSKEQREAIISAFAPKKGHWDIFDVPWYKCSECGALRDQKAFLEKYCPNCGANMQVKDGEVYK